MPYEIYEITGYRSGIARDGVNYLEPADSFQNIEDGYIYRQVLQSRRGFQRFSTGQLDDQERVMGIFTFYLRDFTKETLVVTKKHLYKYDAASNTFVVQPTGATLPANHTFDIIENDAYVSGTTYPFPDGSDRFVFTGKGMSYVYQYDNTTVEAYTNVASNPSYVDPPEGIINHAKHVIYFGERLNFFVPNLNGVDYPQGILYSGIRTTGGNGEKYDISSSGLINLDTAEFIAGASIQGNVISMNLTASNWTLEKTRDAFNPYFPRKLPSVIGTGADFSFAQWNNEVRSFGQTGIIGTDTRQSLKVDNKIPRFTLDDVDQPNFQLIYGGFDRITSQFLWSYLSDRDLVDDATQNKVLVNNYEEDSWAIYNMRFSVFGETDAGKNLTWDDIDETNNPSWAQWDTTEELWDKIGLGQSVYKTLAGDNDGFIYELNSDNDDYFDNISGITQAAQAVITISGSNYKPGDLVTISGVQGMTEINNFDPASKEQTLFTPYTVIAATLTTVTINCDSTLFTAYTSGGTISKIINFYAETIPFNPYRSQGRMCYIASVEFLLDTNDGNLLVSVYQDEDDTPFIQDVLIKPDTEQSQRQWISMTVDNEANFMTFTLRQQSPSVQVRIVAMRIHCKPGAMTSS
jgi:hypothetical protein